MAQFDGSIRIDTSINSKGFNDGIKKATANMSGSLGKLMTSIKGISTALGLAFAGGAIFRFIKDAVSSFDYMSSSIGTTLQQLNDSFLMFKGAVAGAFLTMLSVIAPVIINIINWLTRLLQIFTAVLRILFGVNVGLSNMATSASGAAGGQKKLADNTKKAGKEAKNSLAPFDELNVLNLESQKINEGDSPDASGGGGSGLPALPDIPVFEGIEEKLLNFKEKFLLFFQPVIDALGRLGEALKPLGQTIWEGLKWAWDNILVPLGEWVVTDLLPKFLDVITQAVKTLDTVLVALKPVAIFFLEYFLKPLGEFVGSAIISFLDFLIVKLAELAEWIKENPQKFQVFITIIALLAIGFFALVKVIGLVMAVAGALGVVFNVVAGVITFLLSPLGLVIVTLVLLIATIVYVIKHWEQLSTTVQQLAFIITFYVKKMVDDIKSAFQSGLSAIQGFFVTTFTNISNTVRSIANNIVGIVNGMISRIIGGINSVIGAVNGIAGGVGVPSIGLLSAPSIPHLATGAVIPPNAKFLAMLGDQKSGTNIEAPERLLRQIVREESNNNGGGDVTIRFEGSLSALAQVLKPYIDKENNRKGSNLIVSSVT